MKLRITQLKVNLAWRRIAPVALAVVVVLAFTYLFWFRNSSLVAVREVQIVGLDRYSGKAARRALAYEARQMTTLNVDKDRLRDAIKSLSAVEQLDVDADFPHGLTITVRERRPVAIGVFGGQPSVLDGEGRLLRNVDPQGTLPKVSLGGGGVVNGVVQDRQALRILTIFGAAPSPLLFKSEGARRTKKGLTVFLRDGPRLIFGDETQALRKWRAAARLLADPASTGASYIDLRIPDRPSIGGLGEAPVTVKPRPPAPLIEPGATATTPLAQPPGPTSGAVTDPLASQP